MSARDHVIPPEETTFDDFPASDLTAPGMRTIRPATTPRYGRIALNVEYAQKSGRSLHLHVIRPPMAQEDPWDLQTTEPRTFPCIMYVQGSSWREQDLGAQLGTLLDFSRRGYVVGVLEYRPSVVAPFPAQVEDTFTATEFMVANAERFHVDPERLVLWGGSSGGHTTLMGYVRSGEGDATASRFGAFVDQYGHTDISLLNTEPSVMDHISAESPEGLLIGGNNVLENPELVASTVIADRIPSTDRKTMPPLLMMHGTKDRLVPFAQSVALYEVVREAGQDVEFYRLEGADHGGPAFDQPLVLDLIDDFIRRAVS